MKRILEPELMDTPEAAAEYNAMDHVGAVSYTHLTLPTTPYV